MNKEFEKHIVNLLKHHDCVVIPNFGAFILKEKSSSIHQNTVFPPGKTLAFNQSVKVDDELLTGAVMQADALNYLSAKNKVLTFANNLSFTLKKDAYVSLPSIGSFTALQNGGILFTPLMTQVFNKSAFGLNPLPVQALVKTQSTIEQSTSATSSKTKQDKLKKERKTKQRKGVKPLVGALLSILAVVVLAALIFTDTQVKPLNYQRAGFIDMFFPNDTHVVSFENIHENVSASRNGILPREGVETGSVLTIESNDFAKGYYMVVGSYVSEENAHRLEQDLFSKGLDTYIIFSEQGLYRVCVFADRTYLPAKEKNETAGFKDSWLLKNV